MNDEHAAVRELMLHIRPLMADVCLRDLEQPHGFASSGTTLPSASDAASTRRICAAARRAWRGFPVADIDADTLG